MKDSAKDKMSNLDYASQRVVNNHKLSTDEKIKRLQAIKVEAEIELIIRRYVIDVSRENFLTLPEGLPIGIGAFEDEFSSISYTNDHWRERLRAEKIVNWKSTQLDYAWTLPALCQFAYADRAKIVYVRFPYPIDDRTILWFDELDFDKLQSKKTAAQQFEEILDEHFVL